MDIRRKQESLQMVPSLESRPIAGEDDILELLRDVYGFNAGNLRKLNGYYDLNFFFHTRSSETLQDKVDSKGCHGYVLKMMNLVDSGREMFMDGQIALLQYVRARDIPVQQPVIDLQQRNWSLQTRPDKKMGKQNGPYIVRVVRFLPGTIFCETPYVAGSYYNVGKFVGKLHRAFDEFHHPFYDNYTILWHMTEVFRLSDFLPAVTEPSNRTIVQQVLNAYQSEVIPKLEKLDRRMIHCDLSEQNILMQEVPGQTKTPPRDRVHDVIGLLDFDHACKSYVIFDMAICICYLSIDCEDYDLQLDAGGYILSGYFEEAELSEMELGLLRTCMCARLCQSLVIGAYTAAQQPGNTYILSTSAKGWTFLHRLWKTPENVLMDRWRRIRDSYRLRRCN